MGKRFRADGEEFVFGSDSFLDVMANLVGIIIILIVVTALRVKQAPPSDASKPTPEIEMALSEAEKEILAKEQEQLKQWERDLLRVEAENAVRKKDYEAKLAARDEELRRLEEAKRNLSAQQKKYQEELTRRKKENDERQHLLRAYETEAAAMIAEAADLETEIQSAAQVQAAKASQAQALTEQLAEKEDQKRQLTELLDKDVARLNNTKATWESITKQLEEVRAELAAIKAKPKPTMRLVHYSSPIAKQAQLQEIHYRCMNGHIANMHLDALLDRAADQIFNRISGTAPQLTGIVGPIGGFRLQYEAEMSGINLTEQLNNPYISRVQLAAWELAGASDDIGETYEQATGRNSELDRSLWSRPPEKFGITMWVYPDSFELARSLRVYLHERGYNVALRPLPRGIPIAGSRHGTASYVQ